MTITHVGAKTYHGIDHDVVETPSFKDYLSSNSGWTQTGTLVTVNSGAIGKIHFANANNGTDRRVHKSLGLTLSNTAWVVRFEYMFTASTIPGHGIFHLSADAGDPYNTTTDAIIVQHNSDVANELQLYSRDGTSQTYHTPIIPIVANKNIFANWQELRVQRWNF